MNKVFTKLAPFIAIVIVIAAWHIIAVCMGIPIIVPTPADTITKMLEVFTTSAFLRGVANSLLRAFLSFSIAFLLATALALLSSLSDFFDRFFYPIVVLVRATPTMSIIFLCLIWFSSKISPMIVATAVIFPTMYASILTAIKSCDKKLLEMSAVYNVPTKVKVFKLYLPYVSDKIFSDAVNALSLNLKLIVAAEALAATANSLGRLMQNAKANLETATLFAYTVAAIILSYLLEVLLKLLRRLFRRIKYAKAN